MPITQRVSGAITEGTTKRLEFGGQGAVFNAWGTSWGKLAFTWTNDELLTQIGITQRVPDSTASIDEIVTMWLSVSTSTITENSTQRIPAGDFVGLVGHLIVEGDQGSGPMFLTGDMTDGDDHIILEGDEGEDVRAVRIIKRVTGI